jgi:hypothetical protein
VAGTLGSSTAGVKSIPSTVIVAGTYKISYVQVSGAAVSPVVTSAAMTVASANFGLMLGTLTGSLTDIVNPTVATGSVAVAVGDVAVVCFTEQTTMTATAVTDNLGNTYAAISAAIDGGIVAIRGYWSRVSVAGTLTTVNVAVTAGTHNGTVIVAAFQGPFAASPVDANPAGTTNALTTTFACPATGTLAQASELVVSYTGMDGNKTITAVSPNVLALRVNSATTITSAMGYQVVASTASVAPEFNVTVVATVNAMGTVSFKKA